MSPVSAKKDLDVVVIGRAAIDLYAEQIGRPLEEVESFSRYLGGCAGNIAVGTRRLGLRSAMLTRVGDEPFGTFVTRFLADEGVDVTQVRRDKEHRTGLVLLGIDPPRHFPIVFYREQCADIFLSPEELDPAFFARTRALVLTGTGLSKEPSRAANLRAAELARENGAKVVVDLDYRPMLWPSREAARAGLAVALELADLIVGTEEEYQVAGGSDDLVTAVAAVRHRAPGIVVVKRGERGSSVYATRDAKPVEAKPFRVEVLNVLGAGDGYMSGFLYGWLGGRDLAVCARLGNGVGAIVVTRHGCAPAMPTRAELEAFIAAQGGL